MEEINENVEASSESTDYIEEGILAMREDNASIPITEIPPGDYNITNVNINGVDISDAGIPNEDPWEMPEDSPEIPVGEGRAQMGAVRATDYESLSRDIVDEALRGLSGVPMGFHRTNVREQINDDGTPWGPHGVNVPERTDSVVTDSVNDSSDSLPIERTIEEEVEEAPDQLPVNTDTLLINEATSRFSSAIWFDKIQEQKILLAGIGGIGSYVTFLLARMNPYRIILYDDDTVETANLSGQFFSRQDIGLTKVYAAYKTASNYGNYCNMYSYEEKYTASSRVEDVMICGFDNMEARKIYYNNWKEHVLRQPEDRRHKCLYIDGKLSAEEFQILCITGTDDYYMQQYEERFLFTSEEAAPTLCSFKQTTFMANMIGSFITNLFVNFCANQCDVLIERDLPFYTEYNAEMMCLNFEK